VRDIDRIIQLVREEEQIAPIHRQVIITRIEKLPTQEEIAAARSIVYPESADTAPLIPNSPVCCAGHEPKENRS